MMNMDGNCCKRLAVTLFYGAKALSANASVPKSAQGCLVAARRSRNQENGPYDGRIVAAGGLQGWKCSPNRLYNTVVFHVWGSAGWGLYDGKVCKTYLDGGAIH